MPKRKPNPPGLAPKDPNASLPPIFFYYPSEKPYGIFSQWYISPIVIPTHELLFLLPPSLPTPLTTHSPTITFNCTEQLFMYAKTLLFPSPESLRLGSLILASKEPREQKDLAKRIPHYNSAKWAGVRERVVEMGSYYKFGGNRWLRGVLLGTGGRELWEASRRDRVWGIGYKAHEAEKFRKFWGEGLLGRCLVRVRERIRGEENGEEVEGWWTEGERGRRTR